MRIAVIDVQDLNKLIAQNRPIQDVKSILENVPVKSEIIVEMRRDRIVKLLEEIREMTSNGPTKRGDLEMEKLRRKYSVSRITLNDIMDSGAIKIYYSDSKLKHEVVEFVPEADLQKAASFLNNRIREYSAQKYKNAKDR